MASKIAARAAPVVVAGAKVAAKKAVDGVKYAAKKAGELFSKVKSRLCKSCSKKPPSRRPGSHKSAEKLERQMEQRGWTYDQIEEAVEAGGPKYSAPNNINPQNGATRHIHPETGRSVVLDNKTGEIIHVGGDGFVY